MQSILQLLSTLAGAVLLPVLAEAPQFHNSASYEAADPYTFYDTQSGQFFAYSTEGADSGYSFAVYSSPDLATWQKQPGGVLKTCYDVDGNHLDGGQACWARDWLWAPETYYNDRTGWYYFFFSGRLLESLTADHFRYFAFEEPSKLGVAVSRSPTGPFHEIEPRPIDWYPFDPTYHDVNLIMDEAQMLPPSSLRQAETAPRGTFIPTIDPNVFFDEDGRIYLYASRNAYRNWVWDTTLGKHIEESNIIVVELESDWWDDPTAATMPEIVATQKNAMAADASPVPANITAYNGTGTIGRPPRQDGWTTVISYGADPQAWENYHVHDYRTFDGTKKDRRWSEGSTTIRRPDGGGSNTTVYLLTYSANNYEAASYGVGFATAASPLGPFKKAANNPVLTERPDAVLPIYSTGHGSIVASPSGRNSTLDYVSPQEVTHRTPDGAELFYVHHARNSTASARSLYTTRLTIDTAAVHFGSDDAISMHLTPLDQPLPLNTYPLQMEASRVSNGLVVRVTTTFGGAFDLTEGSNRVVGLPGDVLATSTKQSSGQDGSFVLQFGSFAVTGLAYQRQSVNGTWSTVVPRNVIEAGVVP
ncbi:beta-xylosidase [Grosmannia clavigera kw1407]|uniref:Beta-xylosidase n=1 Tax=Grosmannia clavigera (strain kw1407 / UAMH 11150) TaxID=655863 RepID=F0XET6_GROCL|nr:beta-xylosidase [Grosmannia clavigera kw1407]EFX03910.1 beta-xylosidase [Grosmannia clavigera kw1407]